MGKAESVQELLGGGFLDKGSLKSTMGSEGAHPTHSQVLYPSLSKHGSHGPVGLQAIQCPAPEYPVPSRLPDCVQQGLL